MDRPIYISLPCTGSEEMEAVREPLETGWLTQGPKVAEFEGAFAARHGVEHALACSNCTTGLHLVLAAMGIGPGDEVIVPAFTWVASANAVLYCGATPVLADVDPHTYNLDPARAAEKVTVKTRAVMAVHLFGFCMDMDSLAEAVGDLPIVEDAACAAGADYKGLPSGSLGLAGVFSFHPRKIITTGEGGMVCTNDAHLAARVDAMRNHGASLSEEQRHKGPRPYLLPDFDLLGFNYRMTDLQGAVGLAQLAKLDRFVEERRHMARFYDEALAGIGWLHTPRVSDWAGHSYQAYVCVVDPESAPLSRNEIMERLQAEGIATRPGTHAVHCLGYYRERFGYAPDDFPVALELENNTLALPLHNRMDRADQERIVEVLVRLKSSPGAVSSVGGRL